jgi:uncharacterized membrane protein YdjX (TVP38/TMEM64 family)
MFESLKNALLNVKSSSWQWLLPILYIIVFNLRPVLLIPTFIMNLVAYALFGPIQGFFLVLFAEQTSAITLYYGVKHLSGDSLKSNFEKLTKKLRLDSNSSSSKQFYLVTVLRFASLPFDFVTASCALSGIKIIPFLLATFLVSIPWVALFFLVISSVSSGSVLETVLNVAIFVTFITISGIIAKRTKLIKQKDDLIENNTTI